MPRPSKGDRKNFTLRMPKPLNIELHHFALDEDQDLNEILLGVIEKWWAARPEREKYQNLREATPAEKKASPKKKAS